ncbi:MAG: tetratricopeptide repeat protein [Myxococcota bacterium]
MTEIDHADEWAQQLEGAYRELGAPRDGDEALLERMSGAAEAASPAAASASIAGTLTLVAIAAVVLGGAVMVFGPEPEPEPSAVVSTVASSPATEVKPSVPERPAAPAVAPTIEAEPKAERELVPEVPTPASESATEDSASPAPPAVARTHSRSKRMETAAELLTRANAERRGGRYAVALGLYRRLQRQFPTTREAATSHMAMGRLYLTRTDEPRRAVKAFEEYLRRNPSGSLAPEAAAGIARAHRKLGDSAAERKAWEHLLARFPDSVYLQEATRALER